MENTNQITYKRYEFLTFEDGKPVKKFTSWFPYNGKQYKYQLNNKLLNEYKEKL